MTPCIAPISHSNTPVRRCVADLAQNWLNPPFTALSRLVRNLTGSETIRLKTDSDPPEYGQDLLARAAPLAQALPRRQLEYLVAGVDGEGAETTERRTEDVLELLQAPPGSPGRRRTTRPRPGRADRSEYPGDIELGDLGGEPVVRPLDDLGLLQVREQGVTTGGPGPVRL